MSRAPKVASDDGKTIDVVTVRYENAKEILKREIIKRQKKIGFYE